MSAPTLNVPLAEAVLKQITEHPRSHRQDTYGTTSVSCGTVHCIAGWTAVLADVEMSWVGNPVTGGAWLEGVRLHPMDGWSDPFYAGMELLGISEDEAGYLFGASEEEAVARLRYLIADARLVTA